LCFQYIVHELVIIKYNNYDMHGDKIKIVNCECFLIMCMSW
jgi:hypothetical protein